MTLPSSPISNPLKCWSLPSAPTWMPLTLVIERVGEARRKREALRRARAVVLIMARAHSIVRAAQ